MGTVDGAPESGEMNLAQNHAALSLSMSSAPQSCRGPWELGDPEIPQPPPLLLLSDILKLRRPRQAKQQPSYSLNTTAAPRKKRASRLPASCQDVGPCESCWFTSQPSPGEPWRNN
jgi:hypothetical protein